MTKIMMPFLLCCLLSSTMIFAQSANEKAVANALENFRHLMVKPDKAGLENLAADELSYGHSNGLIEDKAAFVDDIVTGKSIFKSANFENQTIKLAGDVAIVRHRLTGDTFNKNIAGKVDLLVLMIWKKQNGEWKMLARQAAKLPS